MNSKFYKKSFFFIILSLLVLGLSTRSNASMLNNFDPDQLGRIRIHRFTGTTAQNPTSGTPLNGIPYTVTRVRLIEGLTPSPDVLRDVNNFEVIAGDDGFTLTASTINGVATFDDLPQGIYKIVEGEHSITPIGDRVESFIVGLPRMIDDEWIYEVDVFPKTEDDDVPSVSDKELDVVWEADVESLVATWTLEATIPRLIGNATRFEFVDTLNSNLTFLQGTVVGFYNTMSEGGSVTNQTLPLEHFLVTESGNDLIISLTQSGFDYLSRNALISPDPFGTIRFEFRTLISSDRDAVGEIYNSARLYYNDDDGIETESPENGIVLYGLEISKVDVNGDFLSEATFELFLDATGNTPAFPIEIWEGAIGTMGNREFTTVNGQVFIPHLLAGTFYLQETESPEGYRLISERMQINISEESATNSVVSVNVVNDVEGGFILPETGGVGTVMFTVVGIVLIGAAVTLILFERRRSSQE